VLEEMFLCDWLCIADDISKTSKAVHMGQPIGRTNDVMGVCNPTWKTACDTTIGFTGLANLHSRSGLIFRMIAVVIIVAMLPLLRVS
jgi:hypothetical protein